MYLCIYVVQNNTYNKKQDDAMTAKIVTVTAKLIVLTDSSKQKKMDRPKFPLRGNRGLLFLLKIKRTDREHKTQGMKTKELPQPAKGQEPQ